MRMFGVICEERSERGIESNVKRKRLSWSVLCEKEKKSEVMKDITIWVMKALC